MRFAGMRVENFLNPNKPDFGNVASQGMENRSALNNAATITESQVNQAGLTAAAKVEAANLIGDAQSAQADASTFAAGVGMIGDIAGGVMGGMGGGGGSIGVPRTSSGMGVPGSVAPGTKSPYYGPAW